MKIIRGEKVREEEMEFSFLFVAGRVVCIFWGEARGRFFFVFSPQTFIGVLFQK